MLEKQNAPLFTLIMLNDSLLEKYIHNFYGYGNLNSKFWFISLEEGGGHSEKEIQNRINAWENRGLKQLEDCKSYHLEFGIAEWFQHNANIQNTWKMYIRMYFYAVNNSDFINSNNQKELIRRYQRDKFGKINGEMCIMELRPLPSKNLNTWLYKDFSNLTYLKDKESYEKYVDDFRINELKNKISTYKPKFVIFLSRAKKYVPIWEKIIDSDLSENYELGFYYSIKNQTNFFITEHAVAKSYMKNGKRVMGLGNDYFNKIGKHISNIG